MYPFLLTSFVVLGMCLSTALSAEEPSAGSAVGAQIGSKPLLELPAASGEDRITLTKYRGSLVLVHFWDPSSESGREDLREIAAVRERYGPRGLQAVGVVVTRSGGEAPRLPDSLKLQWPQATASSDAERPAVGEWLGKAPYELPRRFLLAPDGTLLWTGDAAADLDAAVRDGLAERPPFKDLDADAARGFIQDDKVILLDVRTPAEFAAGHLQGAINIDIMRTDFANAVARLPADRDYLVYCKSGGRSIHACEIMSNLKFEGLRNLVGGITAWQEAELPVVGQE